MNNKKGYYMPMYRCKLCGEALVGIVNKPTDEKMAISITDSACCDAGYLSVFKKKRSHICDDGSVGIAELIGMKYFKEQES